MTGSIEHALAWVEKGDLQQAIRTLDRPTGTRMDRAQAFHLRALFCLDLSMWAQAKESLEAALALSHDNVGILTDYAQLLNQLEDAQAESVYARIYELDRRHALACLSLADFAYGRSDVERALQLCSTALALPGALQVVAYSKRSLLYAQQGQADLAKNDALQAIALDAGNASGHLHLGLAEYGLGNYHACIVACDRALGLQPRSIQALMNKGLACLRLKEFYQAIDCFKAILRLDGEFIRVYGQLSVAYYHALDMAAVQKCLDRRAELVNDFQGRWLAMMTAIAIAPESQIEARQMRKNFMRELSYLQDWLEKNPSADAWREMDDGVTPFYYTYHALNDKALLQAYGDLCHKLFASVQARFPPRSKPQPRTRLRLGVIAANIRDHAVWQDKIKGLYLFAPTDVEIHTFYCGEIVDAQTQLAEKNSAYFKQGRQSFEAWAEAIYQQDLDVIYYPEIGLDSLVANLACLRLAPVQITSWGNPLTSGLSTIDHFISAEVFESGEASEHYTEQLHLLHSFPSYYEGYEGAAEPVEGTAFGLDADKKWLLCAGTAFKYQFDFVKVYADIAEAADDVQLVFFQFDTYIFNVVKQKLQDEFRVRGLAPGKLVFCPWLTRAQYQYVMHKSCLLLDSIGFSGINTVMQALEVGLPVVTVRGELLRGRLGSGVLDAVGMQDWVAQTQEDYVRLALRLLADGSLREAYRQRLQQLKPQMFGNRACVDETYALIRALAQMKI